MPYGTPPRTLPNLTARELRWADGFRQPPDDLPVRAFGNNIHLLVYPKGWGYVAPRRWTGAQVSLLIAEPTAIHGRHVRLARLMAKGLFRILTFNADLLRRVRNARLLVPGNAWVPADLVPPAERGPLSIIASRKTALEGHRLRHEVIRQLRAEGLPVAALGGGYQPFERKQDGLLPYRFSVIVENSREPHYFTEKLIDALLTQTVPIYWGAPNIGDYFDVSGMIVCDTRDAVITAARNAFSADIGPYRAGMIRNRQKATTYMDHEARALALIAAEAGAEVTRP